MSFLSFVPAGVILPYGGNAAPGGWLLCNGSSISQAVYPALYAAIGVNWGDPGGGSFNIPDLRGSFVRGAGTSGSRVGPAVGAEQGQTTAKNGLNATGGTASLTGTTTFAADGHAHSFYGVGNRNYTAGSGFNYTNGGAVLAPGQWYPTDTNGVNASVGISSTAAGLTVGDTETRPYSKGVNYIIKI